MSLLVVVFSIGHVRRVPLTTTEAQALYDRFPGHRGQLVLEDSGRVWFQRRVFLAVPVVVARTWMRAARALWGVAWSS